MNGEKEELLFQLRFSSSPDRLKMVRALVGEAGRICGLSEADANDLVIAVNEACQNVICHAYGGDPREVIVLEFLRCGDSVVMKLRDFAPSVEVEKIKPRDIDDIRPGGLGTHFIGEVMDETAFMSPRDGGGNILRMVKKIG
ncbi:MAG: serine/threonine protein phosphatase [Rhodospirillaceae bacterium]|jgi:sigma-B regulation protein RsbU (phosphoserine phosphatase)|nr:serine/threonine protein phosphatase [Rhodospirillaceae bacterium]MDP6305023.1 ATP-binding protein [Alphaproteobacteria bacterium]MDP7122850.1 ATP-binding protein [Alphaproteobacteria bacterium]MDP7311636.1 ATP-binding protein [Alphaproteobacteria bacterium]MDP7669469.1 ATP-binding protein [Alphaproteobacteria bacterium]